ANLLTLYLQASMGKGQYQQVRYDDVSLIPTSLVAWSVPGGAVLDASGLSAHVRFDRKGQQAVYANATDGGIPLWNAVGVFDVRNAVPVANLTVPAESPINQPLVLDATGSLDSDAPLVLQDPSFTSLGSTWKLSGKEVGGTVKATALNDPRGGVKVEVARTAKAGSIYVAQEVPLGRVQPAILTVRVQDQGDLTGYAFLLRESNGTFQKDTPYTFPPAGDRERLLSMPWTPQTANATRLTVYLRFRLPPDSDTVVRFMQPRLISGLAFTWAMDGNTVATGPDPTYTLLPRAAGTHVATVTVADQDGASASASRTINYTDSGYLWESPPPGVLPLSPPTPLALHTIRRGEGREDQIDNGDFSAGKTAWTLADREVGGGAAWRVLSEAGSRFARINVSKAATSGTVYLQQDARRLCTEVSCTFSFDYRGSAQLDMLLRERNATGIPTDVNLPLPPSPGWRHIERSWNVSANATRLTVHLRARLVPDQNASVDFRAVSLQPSLRIDTAVSGPAEPRIRNGTLAAPAPGRYSLRVNVTNAYGQAGTFDRDLQVLPVAVFPTPEGLALRWRTGNGTVRVLNETGATAWSLDLAQPTLPASVPQFYAGDQGFPRLPRGNGTLLLAADGAEAVFPLAGLRERLAGPLMESNATLVRSGWHNVARVRLHTPNDAILGGTARVLEGDREVADAPFVREGQDLVAEVPLPTGLSAHDYRVTVELQDGWGGTLQVPGLALSATPNPAFSGGLLLLGAAALVVGLGLAHRRWQRRRAG
ncbi:MAG: PKD domain-containing protein, partial [Halobacteriales archaeon]|nr:PKD domain-containing protein [Halobacteriales archaeon]